MILGHALKFSHLRILFYRQYNMGIFNKKRSDYMSFFDFLGKVASNVQRQSEQNSRSFDNTEERLTGSALSPGRMRQTDVVKGKNSPLPKEPGLYRHRNKTSNEIDYVGQTNNIRKRQQEHTRNSKLNTDTHYVQYGRCRDGSSKDTMLQTEKNHIKRHKPPGNSTGGGNGRR